MKSRNSAIHGWGHLPNFLSARACPIIAAYVFGFAKRSIRLFKKAEYCIAVSALLLTGCNTTTPSPKTGDVPSAGDRYAQQRVTPEGFTLPSAGGCLGAVARYRAIMDNDYQMGQVNRQVFSSINEEIDRAASACSAGHDNEAVALIRASRARHGYPD